MTDHHNHEPRQHQTSAKKPIAAPTRTARHGRERMPDRRVHSHNATTHRPAIIAANQSVGRSRINAIASGVTSSAVITRCFTVGSVLESNECELQVFFFSTCALVWP